MPPAAWQVGPPSLFWLNRAFFPQHFSAETTSFSARKNKQCHLLSLYLPGIMARMVFKVNLQIACGTDIIYTAKIVAYAPLFVQSTASKGEYSTGSIFFLFFFSHWSNHQLVDNNYFWFQKQACSRIPPVVLLWLAQNWKLQPSWWVCTFWEENLEFSERLADKKKKMAAGGRPQTGQVTGLGPSIQTGCLPVVFVELLYRNINPSSNMPLGSVCQLAMATSSAARTLADCLVTLHEALWMESNNWRGNITCSLQCQQIARDLYI